MKGSKRADKRRSKKEQKQSQAAESQQDFDVSEASIARRCKLAAWAVSLTAVALGIWMVNHTWLKLTDSIVDYGRELYVPWRLAEGDVLYRDIAYFNGPLSPYWNTLWFRLCGTGHHVLLTLNVVLLGVFAVLMHRLLARLGSNLAAGFWLLFALPVFFFAHNFGIANYNFISPYSHEMTHGLLLSIVALGISMRVDPAAPNQTQGLVGSGLFLGLVFLTKAEFFVAACVGVCAVYACKLVASKSPKELWIRALTQVLAGTVAVPLIAFLLLLIAMPAGLAAWSVLGSWTGIFASELTELSYYKVGMGTDQPGANLGLMLESLAFLALVIAPGLLLDLLFSLGKRKPLAWVLAGLLAGGAFVVWRASDIPVDKLARPLPFVLGLVALQLVSRLYCSKDAEQQRTLAARLGFTLFALALLAKMILNVRFVHYGFALCVPAMGVLFLMTTAWLPSWVRARGGSGLLVAASAIGVFAAIGFDRWQGTERMLLRKKNEVSAGSDLMLMDSRGLYIEPILRQIEQRFGPDDELLALPEGIMVNYLSRRRIAVPYTNFMPPELLLYGEEKILSDLKANPPAGVILVHKVTAEYGFPLFGTDYGNLIMDWVEANYEQTWIGRGWKQPLLPETEFGMAIMQRKQR